MGQTLNLLLVSMRVFDRAHRIIETVRCFFAGNLKRHSS